jgi:hypothetical protein
MHMHSLKMHSRWCSMHSWKRASWVHHPPNRQGLQWRDMLAWKSPGPGLSLLHPVLLTGGYEASYQRGALLRVIQHLLHEGTACGASERVRVVVAGAKGGVGGGQGNAFRKAQVCQSRTWVGCTGAAAGQLSPKGVSVRLVTMAS